ncbi:hypothetical protein TWF569_000522 [Orbilia oligospora]|uniref:Uncharacterized protein n=1 Tax=Orbilia oligospora TaxID=2813651 RepID=A0A7C8JSY9_ORBOL|nr:hypothetical protein TWF102_004249 [Orbilia oligospora]KAF3117783.1 hypothetical protein TWF103_004458 [Orbilia oligospora]KAF3126444.1 hypothetical protein TWF569_000522 [Orbilia oligospora]
MEVKKKVSSQCFSRLATAGPILAIYLARPCFSTFDWVTPTCDHRRDPAALQTEIPKRNSIDRFLSFSNHSRSDSSASSMVAQHIFHVIQVISSARADPIFLLPRLILVQNGHDGWFVVSWFPRRQIGRILGTSLQTR